jgi:cell division protein ZapA
VSDEAIPVTVQILDKDYRIACSPGEEVALVDCARLLDARMREVRQNGRVIGADRIAVMAALNLLYDIMSRSAGVEQNTERLAHLQQRLEDAVRTNQRKSKPAVARVMAEPDKPAPPARAALDVVESDKAEEDSDPAASDASGVDAPDKSV